MPRLLVVLLALVFAFPVRADAAEPPLRAGVARVDITPPTGYPLGGWVRADRVADGVHTRLYATVLVLQRGEQKVALVAQALFASPGGLVKEAAERVKDRGFSEANVLVSASHTHAGPSKFANFPTLNTVAPSAQTVTDPSSFAGFLAPAPAEPEIYTFLVERLSLALRRADDRLGPAVAGWGETTLETVTKNRSIEAHLANHGIVREYGTGSGEEDPEGVGHTIDPRVHFLRVDRLGPVRKVRCRRVTGRGGRGARVRRVCRRPARRRTPLGGWANFANHGTVNPSEFTVYNNDHHASALLAADAEIRRLGRVPASRQVVTVYGNGNEGDQSAGLGARGPLHAERVGRAEAEAFVRAWRSAGRRLSSRPALGLRWTRVCFCGQRTAAGTVSSQSVPGIPFLTGSEEGRGPLFDITRQPFEGVRAPNEPFESHGHKLGAPITSEASYPKAVPVAVVRVGDRMIATLPAEPTVEVGRRARAAVLAAAPAGVGDVVVSGLVNEFIQYLTTPEEYDRQHYEGGSTIYGPASSVLLQEQLATLAAALRDGRPAPEPYGPFDPRNGVVANAAPYPAGAPTAAAREQPAQRVRPGAQVAFSWDGGERGYDRPLDTAFVTVERPTGERVADDLGLSIVWRVDPAGRYTAVWQSPRSLPAGEYRFLVTGRRYQLVSRPFTVAADAPETADVMERFTLG